MMSRELHGVKTDADCQNSFRLPRKLNTVKTVEDSKTGIYWQHNLKMVSFKCQMVLGKCCMVP